MDEDRIEDLDVPKSESEAVKGGDGLALDGEPAPPVGDAEMLKKLPGKRKPPTLTLK